MAGNGAFAASPFTLVSHSPLFFLFTESACKARKPTRPGTAVPTGGSRALRGAGLSHAQLQVFPLTGTRFLGPTAVRYVCDFAQCSLFFSSEVDIMRFQLAIEAFPPSSGPSAPVRLASLYAQNRLHRLGFTPLGEC